MSIVKGQADTSASLHIIFLFCKNNKNECKDILRNMTICLPALACFFSCFKLIVNNSSVVSSALLFNIKCIYKCNYGAIMETAIKWFLKAILEMLQLTDV